MKAFLLAAGDSHRLRPLTEHVPKPMLVVGGRPILEHNIRWLASYGIREVVINLHHCPEVVTEFFGDGSRWGVSITYSPEPVLQGTAGALRPFADFMGETFLLIYADNISTCNIERLARHHKEKGGVGTIAVFEREDVSASGVVEMASDDRVLRFVEKPKPGETSGNWVNAGIVVLDRAALNPVSVEGPSDFGRDIFPKLLEQGDALYGYRMSERLWWIDSPADYERTQQELAAGLPVG